jgi:hypothetical protein
MEYGGVIAFVDDLFVRPPFRRAGLATAALAQVRNFCMEQGVRALFVETGRDNVAAQATTSEQDSPTPIGSFWHCDSPTRPTSVNWPRFTQCGAHAPAFLLKHCDQWKAPRGQPDLIDRRA